MREAVERLPSPVLQEFSIVKETVKKPSIVVVGIKWPMETFLYRLLSGLVDAGFSITIASTDKPDVKSADFKFKWLKLTGPEGKSIAQMVRFLFLFLRSKIFFSNDLNRVQSSIEGNSLRETAYELHRFLPLVGNHWDIMYFPWNASAVSFLPVFNLGIPVIISCRGSHVTVTPHNPAKQYMRHGLRETFERAAAVHCVSQATFNEAAEYGLELSKSRIIRPAVDPEFFIPLSGKKTESQVLKVISTGSLVWRKGYVDALMAIRRLVDSGFKVQYEIIGEGEDYQAIVFSVQDLGLQDHVVLHGRLPADEIKKKLQHADIFLLTSLTEGISNAVLEGMSCGLPVVTTESGGMREAVTNGVEGYVVPIMDPDSVANALEQLARDPALRLKMGSAARARILKDFTLTHQVNEFQDLCLEVVAKHHAGNVNEPKTQYRTSNL